MIQGACTLLAIDRIIFAERSPYSFRTGLKVETQSMPETVIAPLLSVLPRANEI